MKENLKHRRKVVRWQGLENPYLKPVKLDINLSAIVSFDIKHLEAKYKREYRIFKPPPN